MAPDYENLTLIQKMEVFQCALDNTNGNDLYKVLWLKSKNSEVHPALSIGGRERER
jgi:serine/threonine-protein kinase mTOR